jgi:hypothetical protein
MKRHTKGKTRSSLKKKPTTDRWHAACDDGHPPWRGLSRDRPEKAQVDAQGHDLMVHGAGQGHAVVVPGN